MLAVLGAVGLSLFALGCPEAADLQHADEYPAPVGVAGTSAAGSSAGGSSAGGSSAAGSGGMMMANCETMCMQSIIDSSCKICHGGALKSAMLDLGSPNYTSRLKDVPATHGDLPATNNKCQGGEKLIDTAMPMNSWLLKKVMNQQGMCGDYMPSGAMLGASDLKCVQDYVACVAGGM